MALRTGKIEPASLCAVLRSSGRPENTPLIRALQQTAAVLAPSRDDQRCIVCTASYPTGSGRVCPVCRWPVGRRGYHKSFARHLLVLGACAVKGIEAIPDLRHAHIPPSQFIPLLVHLIDHPEIAQSLAQAVRDAVPIPDEPDTSEVTSIWPAHSYRSDDTTLLNVIPQAVLKGQLQQLESAAWVGFRHARWKTVSGVTEYTGPRPQTLPDDGPYWVTCPYCCRARALTAGYRHRGAGRKEYIRRWRCLTTEQLTTIYLKDRERERDPRTTNKTRLVRPRREEGCGQNFSDTTGTPFHLVKVPMRYWLFLLYYGAPGLAWLQRAGVSAAVLAQMLDGLLTLRRETPDLTTELVQQTSRFVITKLATACCAKLSLRDLCTAVQTTVEQ